VAGEPLLAHVCKLDADVPIGVNDAVLIDHHRAVAEGPAEFPDRDITTLCCAAAGIIAPSSAPNEALIPLEKLRGAAVDDAMLSAQERPPAQPAVGYTHAPGTIELPPKENARRSYGPTDLIGRAA